jgi:pilus assembly protein CpaE
MPGTRSILVVCPNNRLLGELGPLIAQHLPLTPIIEITHYPNRKEIADGVAATQPGLCFLDVGTDKDRGLSVLSDLMAVNPGLQVIALLSDNNPDLILTCLRQGATEFLLRPLNADQLNRVLDRLSQMGAASVVNRGDGKVFCALPAKGACGASTIASNLAHQWKRLGSKRILLADMDPVTGTISFLLKIKSNYSFLDALSRSHNMDSDLWKGLVTSTHGIDVLLSPDNPMDGTQELPDPGPIIDFCRRAYETVTIDIGNPYSRWAGSLAALSDEVLLITTNELPALRAAQRVLDHLDRGGVDKNRIRLIVNRYNPDVGLTEEAVETALHTDVFHMVPSDYESVQRALVDGKPIGTSSPFGKSLNVLAEELYGKKPVESTKKKGWTSIFSSLVSRG